MINCIFLPYGQFYYHQTIGSSGILIDNAGGVSVLADVEAFRISRENQSVEHFNRASGWDDSDNLPAGVNEFASVFI